MSQDNIMLGDGVFSVGGVDVGLTRGGGQWILEREFRSIEADGDRGDVKGRIRILKEKAKLVMNILELLPGNITKFYPALSRNTTDPNKDVVTGTLEIVAGDYNTVTWTGRTLNGKPIVITLENAINLENIDWSLVDKDENVPKATYTSTYDPATRSTPPWNVQFFNTAVPDTVIPVATLLTPQAGAQTSLVISFNELLHADTLAISDRFNLLSSLKNDALVANTTIAITSLADSVEWFNKNSTNPFCIVTIASTTFVTGQTVRANMKAAAVKDRATVPNVILAATNSDAVVLA